MFNNIFSKLIHWSPIHSSFSVIQLKKPKTKNQTKQNIIWQEGRVMHSDILTHYQNLKKILFTFPLYSLSQITVTLQQWKGLTSQHTLQSRLQVNSVSGKTWTNRTGQDLSFPRSSALWQLFPPSLTVSCLYTERDHQDCEDAGWVSSVLWSPSKEAFCHSSYWPHSPEVWVWRVKMGRYVIPPQPVVFSHLLGRPRPVVASLLSLRTLQGSPSPAEAKQPSSAQKAWELCWQKQT